MISILIPVFNFEIVSLVTELSRQLSRSNVEGEILVFDDFSSLPFRELNHSITGLDFVAYRELDRNYGRTAIRKILASHSKYEWLLFLDSDSRILRPNFIELYISAFKNESDVYIGGRVYPTKPSECNKRLHWKYGVNRESPKGSKTAFHTNNFCIKKTVFSQFDFPDFLNQYGHEDTWMGIELERTGKTIQYLDNTVQHIQIENTETFLKKTQDALQNLFSLKRVIDKKILANHVALFKSYCFIRNLGLEFAVDFIYRSLKNRILQNLNSCHPSLIIFDFYRLYYLMQIGKRNDH